MIAFQPRRISSPLPEMEPERDKLKDRRNRLETLLRSLCEMQRNPAQRVAGVDPNRIDERIESVKADLAEINEALK